MGGEMKVKCAGCGEWAEEGETLLIIDEPPAKPYLVHPECQDIYDYINGNGEQQPKGILSSRHQ